MQLKNADTTVNFNLVSFCCQLQVFVLYLHTMLNTYLIKDKTCIYAGIYLFLKYSTLELLLYWP